ncbi:hypothetical protein GGH94_003792 [Coemansia aciculifera]|uniref:Uncharacterized protein n=1 Tax=Coemansia aciculifera TaxID=417176 RepID=A0A9W8IGG4_9FUNG|nr:hypothetical protein GGH94_003792 [Coemansia aciculifera]
MSALSPLQFLPEHVVKLIVNHITGSSRVFSDGVRVNSPKYRMLLKPLLWVCHNFRAVAYSRYCNNFELNLSNLSFDDLDPRYLRTHRTDIDYRTLNYLGYSTHRSAKDVTVFLDERAVYSGEALEMASRAPYDSCSFPLARKIAFIFVKDANGWVNEDVGIDPLIAGANICDFVERIKQMAPLVGEISVQPVDNDDMLNVSNQYFGDLASRLYQLACRIEYNYHCYPEDSMRLQLDTIRNLTHISTSTDPSIGNVDQFIQLARKNALTLQSLVLKCEQDIDILSLVRDAGGNHVTYPRLLTLKLWSESESEELKRPVFHGAAPFPLLQRLTISHQCLFDDDTFFRGNAATLEWLDMQLDHSNASVLHKFKVFVPGSHPKLRVVKLSYSDDSVSELFASPAEVLQFVYRIGPGAAIREYTLAFNFDVPTTSLSSLGNYTCIQVLSLPSVSPVLWDVITLIKSLPLLSDLYTSLPKLGPIPDGVTMDELPEHVISNYAPMGRRFRCWHLNRGLGYNYTEAKTCVLLLLLALACPNFDYATPPSIQRGLFMKRMETEIYSDRFKSYAPRLRRLLFSGWSSC